MASDSATKNYLHNYVTERLPALTQGSLENPNDPPSIAEDRRYTPLQPLPYQI
jgi:hypothetical protein